MTVSNPLFPNQPGIISATRKAKQKTKGVYRTDDEYFADVIKVFQKELQVLYDHGLRNDQIDDPNICCACSCLYTR